jgi:hypothetical protein
MFNIPLFLTAILNIAFVISNVVFALLAVTANGFVDSI